MGTTERAFEESIENSLLTDGGYFASHPNHFEAALGLDLVELFAFIDVTQQKAWNELVARGYGGNVEEAKNGFAKRLANEIDLRGTVDVLRHAVTDYGVSINLAYFKPAHGLTPSLENLYQANRVTVTRQFKYENKSENSIDLALLVNGIPTATAELKNPITGQTVEHAKKQYRVDRDPNNVTLARRALVHFCVDPDLVAMTTKLEGEKTRFLPFNQGTGGAGQRGRAGNPPSTTTHRTAYLWEDVWQRGSWLDILARFIHVDEPKKGSKAEKAKNKVTVFPRFHQWDVVRKLEADAKVVGAGKNYLVQHSAGSGKSNTIAWISHRLANLHDGLDRKVFDKVIVITDRLVLDQQLQETIYQFEHAKGVVERVDRDSDQLAKALLGEQAKIVITTLQKFPFILDKIGGVKARRYAVVVDEAHSSQTGTAAKELRAALTRGEDADRALIEAEREEVAEEAAAGDDEDRMVATLAGRGRQENISFFAFTATPKAKTLELFGQKVKTPDGPRFVPFHLYSMRQAIDEKFILDVLANYTTYETYYRIEKKIEDDPDHDKERAKAAIARFVMLHPTQLAQKAEIIVEHFRQHTAPKINGHAKAMVVTSSRLHAVRYKQAIDKYIHEHKYLNLRALVAFSGKVIDDTIVCTESGMNGFGEKETAHQFAGDDYQVLIVAEKFQTGFDQPLLHTMYVDKVLTGLNAVQTLSRLNRTMDGKDNTFVLDFRNKAFDIERAFAPWFERTEAIPTDPNLLWDTHRAFMNSPVVREDEIGPAVSELLAGRRVDNHAKVYATLDPVLTRFEALDLEDQDDFRELIGRYISIYGFIAQIVSFTDATLERDYIYARALESRLPRSEVEGIDIGAEVKLTHLRIEQTSKGSLSVDEGEGEVKAIYSGKGPQWVADKESLSAIIQMLNERFGMNLNEQDQLLFDQFEETWAADEDVVDQAKNNVFDNFRLVFNRRFLETVMGRMDENETIYKRILDDEEFRTALMDLYATRLYQRLRREA
ncbi:MAG: type I restriction endonuclease subunit R [Acidimicrobiales bacterium]